MLLFVYNALKAQFYNFLFARTDILWFVYCREPRCTDGWRDGLRNLNSISLASDFFFFTNFQLYLVQNLRALMFMNLF